jgi:hypothetical protein
MQRKRAKNGEVVSEWKQLIGTTILILFSSPDHFAGAAAAAIIVRRWFLLAGPWAGHGAGPGHPAGRLAAQHRATGPFAFEEGGKTRKRKKWRTKMAATNTGHSRRLLLA